MPLLLRLNEDVKTALRAGASLKVSTLRMVLAAIHNREIEKRSKSREALTDEEIIDVLRREVKKRKEAIEIYGSAGRTDLKDKEEAELKVIEFYLPPELGDEEIEKVVKGIISIGEKDFGKVMKEAMKQLAGSVEARRVSDVVKKNISQ